MKPAKQKALTLGGLLLATAGFSSATQAACYFSSGSSEQRTSFNMGTITVQRDTPAGTVLADKTAPEGSASNTVSCSTGTWRYTFGELKFTALSQYGNGVYNTNIDGVGIRIYNLSLGSTSGRTFPFSAYFSNPPTPGIKIASGKRVQLVKTSSSDVGAGEITTGTLARSYMQTSPPLYFNTLSLTGGTIVRGACTITNTSIQVPLGGSMRTDFTGVGSTGKQVPFNIPLNCNANTNVKVTLDGTAAPGGAKGVVVLSSSSSETVATGVGVQMLYKNTPVTLGSTITVGTASSGVYNIPLVGRYYQTQANVTSGKANAMATFTMTYN